MNIKNFPQISIDRNKSLNDFAFFCVLFLRLHQPILATGGGGYHVENTVRAWALAWAVLSGQEVDLGHQAAVSGVMLQSTDWQGGLRDRELPVTQQQRRMVLPALEATLETLKAKLFPLHGL